MDKKLKIVDGEFDWTHQRGRAAVLLAQGYTNAEVARDEDVNVNRSTIGRWRKHEEFEAEVDRLSLMYGLASKPARLRLIQQAARQFIDEEGNIDVSGFTLLDLLKEARMQMEGVQIGILSELAAINETARPVAGSGSGASKQLPETIEAETD